MVILLTLLSVCIVLANPTPKIVSSGEAPYAVAVLVQGRLCSGALLTRRWLVTAAHCVYVVANNCSEVTVIVGSLYTPRLSDIANQKLQSDLLVIYPSYKDNWAEHDVALVRLQTPLDMSEYIGTIPLASEPWINGTKLCEVSGFGVLQPTSKSPLDHRLKTHVMDVSRPCPCEQQLEAEMGERVKSWVCSDLRPHSGPCNGDSGAPLVCDRQLWGLTLATFFVHDPLTCDISREPKQQLCGANHILNIFLDIYPYTPWLEEVTSHASSTIRPSSFHLTIIISLFVYMY